MNEPNLPRDGHAMDELNAVKRLLAQPPPRPEAVAAALARLERAGAGRAAQPGVSPLLNGWRAGDPGPDAAARPGAGPHQEAGRRLPGWLSPVAAAAAVAAVVAASTVISGAFGHHARVTGRHPAGQGAATGSAPGLSQVPPYFVSLTGNGAPGQGQRAVVRATTTGAVLGSVTAPAPHTVFTRVAAAGDDRTFVLAVQQASGTGIGPARFYRLVLNGSGRPGRLAPLPVPPQPEIVNGFAVSADGSKLALSILPRTAGRSTIKVFTLATGAERDWVWRGSGFVGWDKPDSKSLSWEADNRNLLFQQHTYTGSGSTLAGTAGAWLLDTAAPAGSLRAASTLVPLPSRALSGTDQGGLQVTGVMLVTGDGARIVAPTAVTIIRHVTRQQTAQAPTLLHEALRLSRAVLKDRKDGAPPAVIARAQQRFRQALAAYERAVGDPNASLAITEFSVRSGKPVLALGRQRFPAGAGAQGVEWVNTSGSTLIMDRLVAGTSPGAPHLVIGVLAGGVFTPLPGPAQPALYDDPTW